MIIFTRMYRNISFLLRGFKEPNGHTIEAVGLSRFSGRQIELCAAKLVETKELPLMPTPRTTYIALLVVQAVHLLHHRLAKVTSVSRK